MCRINVLGQLRPQHAGQLSGYPLGQRHLAGSMQVALCSEDRSSVKTGLQAGTEAFLRHRLGGDLLIPLCFFFVFLFFWCGSALFEGFVLKGFSWVLRGSLIV